MVEHRVQHRCVQRLLLLYAVEVDDTSFGAGLCPAVAAAADQLATEIAAALVIKA